MNTAFAVSVVAIIIWLIAVSHNAVPYVTKYAGTVIVCIDVLYWWWVAIDNLAKVV